LILANPIWLLALPLAILPWIIFRWRGRRYALRISDLKTFKKSAAVSIGIKAYGGVALRSIAIALVVLALARPQSVDRPSSRSNEGIDIVLAVDTSGSMRALDFELKGERVDRLEVVKEVIGKFVEQRIDDRIGMVVFGTEAYTQVPLTLDHQVLHAFLRRSKIGMAGDSTAIGDALATATKRVKDVDAKSRIVILLTDGTNTAGKVDPRTAAKAAASVGVRVYTIGVGSNGMVPMPVQGFFGETIQNVEVELDEALLKEIADTTNGKYFKASDTEALVNVYKAIDELEKRKIEQNDYRRYEEKYFPLVVLALFAVLLEALFNLTRWRRIPA
jgi:Ca-activated chloride channel family protein